MITWQTSQAVKVTCQYKKAEYAIAQVDHPVLLSYVKNIHACNGDLIQTDESEVVGVTNKGHASKEVGMLNLENRVIPKLPPKLSSFFENIRVLYLRSIQLTEISYADLDYPRLNYLSLSQNKLTSLDADLFKNIPKLRVFSVVENPLTKVGRNLLDTAPLLTHAYFYKTSCIRKLPNSIMSGEMRLKNLKKQLQENCEPTREAVTEAKEVHLQPSSEPSTSPDFSNFHQLVEEDSLNGSTLSQANTDELIMTEPPNEKTTSLEPQKPNDIDKDYFANVQLEETDYDDSQPVERKEMSEETQESFLNGGEAEFQLRDESEPQPHYDSQPQGDNLVVNDSQSVEHEEVSEVAPSQENLSNDDHEGQHEVAGAVDSQLHNDLEAKINSQPFHDGQPQDDSAVVQNAKKLLKLALLDAEGIDDLRRRKRKRTFIDQDEDEDEDESYKIVADFVSVTHNYDNDSDY